MSIAALHESDFEFESEYGQEKLTSENSEQLPNSVLKQSRIHLIYFYFQTLLVMLNNFNAWSKFRHYSFDHFLKQLQKNELIRFNGSFHLWQKMYFNFTINVIILQFCLVPFKCACSYILALFFLSWMGPSIFQLMRNALKPLDWRKIAGFLYRNLCTTLRSLEKIFRKRIVLHIEKINFLWVFSNFSVS